MSMTIKIFLIFITASFAISSNASSDILILPSDGGTVSISKENNRIVAKEVKNNYSLHVSKEISKHLTLADEARIISKSTYEHRTLFIVLSRELSSPNAMDQGYCGAGYEEYLLLIEVFRSKVSLRDQLLLQSCLNTISMVIENGDDKDNAANGLTANSDGSLSYRLLDDKDDEIRNLVLNQGRFKVGLLHIDSASGSIGQ